MPKGGQSKYTIAIPINDQNEKIAVAAHQYLSQSSRNIIHPHITGPHHGDQGPVKHLIWVTLDNPNSDSSAKQLAVHIAEVANIEAIHVLKEGKAGISNWVMRNKNFSFNKKNPH